MLDSSLSAYAPLLGETAWHSLTLDSTIESVSQEHFRYIEDVLARHWLQDQPPRSFLEVASYAHTTGYLLRQSLGCEVSLLDISATTLRLGRRIASRQGNTDSVRLFAADFHQLPFDDEQFDVVYISASLHHTWRWKKVLRELQRVTAPNGLLLLSREPCARFCCLYRFRTNRVDSFNAFEKKLQELGILRTIAEPFLGSRPETLFGMIENQTIPIQELIEELNATTEIVEENLNPASTMSSVDHAWVQLAFEKPEEAQDTIRTHFMALCHQAGDYLDSVSRGLGYSLPTAEEQEALVNRVGPVLKELVPRDESQVHERQLSAIFGAETNFIARKRPSTGGSQPVKKRPRSAAQDIQVMEQDGVYFAFAPSIAKLLVQPRSLLPNIQDATPGQIEEFFPPFFWYAFEDNEIRTLTLYRQPGRIRLPGQKGDRLLALRFYGLPPEQGGCTMVSVWQNGVEIFSHRVWQPESFLCAVRLAPPRGGLRPELMVQCLSGDGEYLESRLNVSVAGLYDLD